MNNDSPEADGNQTASCDPFNGRTAIASNVSESGASLSHPQAFGGIRLMTALLGHSILLCAVTPPVLHLNGIHSGAIISITVSCLLSFLLFARILWNWHTGTSVSRAKQMLRLLALVIPMSALATFTTLALIAVIDGKFDKVLESSSYSDFYIVFLFCTGIISSAIFLPLTLIRTSLLSRETLGRYFMFSTEISTEIPITQSIELFYNSIGLSQFLAETPSARIAAIEDLRQRGRRLRTINAILLGFVMSILVCAALFVVFAGQVAGRDTQSLDSLLTVRQSIDSQEESVRALEDERVEITGRINKAQLSISSKSSSEKEKANSDTTLSTQKAMLTVVSDRTARATSELQRRRELYGKLEQAAFLEKPGSTDEKTATNLLLAAGITRFGVLAITIYLVQILIGLYRYNAQVAAHYFSQSDALLLTGHSPAEFGELSTKLRLTVSFGKPETSIPEKTLDKLGEIIKSASERIRGPAELLDKK